MMLALMIPATGIQAQSSDSRSLHWARWDVVIDQIDTTQNSFRVTETYNLVIDSGPFHGGFRNIPLNRIDRIDNIQISDNGRPLQMLETANCPTSRPGTGCYYATGPIQQTSSGNSNSYSFSTAQEKLTYVFTNTLNDGDTRNVSIVYTVHGALRSYTGGDQLYWSALATDRNFAVQASRVTVALPDGLTADKVTTYPATWTTDSAATSGTLTFNSPGDLGTYNGVEIRIQYPHNPAMPRPAWQATYDTIQNANPILTLVALLISGVLLVGGILFAILRMTAHQRGMRGIVVPEYLTEPPSDLAPGVADALIHLGTQTRDVLGTLLDLARRGYLVIEQGDRRGGFVLHRTDKPTGSDLASYESMMLTNMFKTGETRSLSDLSQQFYSTTEAIQAQLITTLLEKGYIKKRPATIRLGWIALALLCFGGAVVAGALTALLVSLDIGLSLAIPVLPALALFMLAIVFFIVSGMMPSRTPAGEQEAAKWKAFRHYLENLKRYNGQPTPPAQPVPTNPATNPASATYGTAGGLVGRITQGVASAVRQPLTADDQFSRFIGYAVAFGVERVWMPQITQSLSYFPPWYYPGYMYGGRSYRDYGYGYDYQSGQLGRPLMPDSMGGGNGMNIAGGGGNFDLGRSLNQASTESERRSEFTEHGAEHDAQQCLSGSDQPSTIQFRWWQQRGLVGRGWGRRWQQRGRRRGLLLITILT